VHLAVYLPFLTSLLLGAAAPALAHRLPPATATRLLAGSAVLAAAATCAALGFLAATALGRLPELAAAGHWSAGRLAATTPVPLGVGLAAVAAVAVGAVNGLRVLAARGRAGLAVRALGRDLAGGGQLVVVDEDIETVAVPTSGGRILASRAHLAELPADERRALLLHESAHLAHRHHLYRLVVATLALLAVGSAAHAQEDTESVFEHAMVGTHAVPPSLHVVAAGARHHR
jgi:Zn-dependent protease with chaperone function